MAEVATAMLVPVDVKCADKGKPKADAIEAQIQQSSSFSTSSNNNNIIMSSHSTNENANHNKNGNGNEKSNFSAPRRKKRRLSAIRDFPPGCGRYASPLHINPKPYPNSDPDPNNDPSPFKDTAPGIIFPFPPSTMPVLHKVETPVPSASPAVITPVYDLQQKIPSLVSSVIEVARTDALPAPQQEQFEIVEEIENVVVKASPGSSDAACPYLTEYVIPGRIFPIRSVSAIRDFPYGCGRNAPLITREECVSAVAPLKSKQKTTMKQPIKNPSASEQTFCPTPDPKTSNVENQVAIISNDQEPSLPADSEPSLPKDAELVPDPFLASSLKALGNAPEEEKHLTDVRVDHPLNQPKPENLDTFEANDMVGNASNESEKCSTPSQDLHNSPDEEKHLSDGLALLVLIDHDQPQCKPEMSQKSNVKDKVSNLVEVSPLQKPKVEIVDYDPIYRDSLDFEANKVDSQLALVCMGAEGTPNHGVFYIKQEGETLPDGQALTQSSRCLRSQSRSTSSHISEDRTANGRSMTNRAKKKASIFPKPKVQCVNFALTPLDSTDVPITSDDGTVTRSKVRETMRLFQVLYRKFLQGEENHANQHQKGPRRPDVLASNILKENNKWVNTGKQIVGNVPGVEVGDEFHYRIELCIVGLHRQSQGGIDYLKQGNTIIATSIVASDGYADDIDTGELLIYTGQGGKGTGKDKKVQSEDQKLERGNLSLKNCIDLESPVRVIRGVKDSKSSSGGQGKDGTRSKGGMKYTYDGLYFVEKYWQERGASGYSVFKFQLRRRPGQPELAWNILKLVGRSKKGAPREGLLCQDASEGKETTPICVVNTADDEAGPPDFIYTNKIIYPSWYKPSPPRGCDCVDGCSDSDKCFCAVKNGGELPYNYNGAIVEAKPIVYECGPCCKCPPNCHNRVSQHGVRISLEIFKTDKRGWGVRSLCSISSGSFICEYTGELLSEAEAEQRTGNDEYLFDIGRSNDQSLWDGLSGLVNELPSHSISETVEDAGYTIDAAKYGGIARFINHSCSPNLYAQNVLYDHDDRNVPHIMLFAAENIPPLQELCYHYNYSIDTVRDSDGNIKKKNCYCGSSECTGRLY